MSKASCCCGVSTSAATGFDPAGRIETKAAKRAVPKRFRDVRLPRPISLNISLSQKNPAHRDELRQVTCSLARYRTGRFCGSAILFGISGSDNFDFDQKSGIGQRCDADNRPCRQIGLTTAKELRVALHESPKIHRRARVVHEEYLHLHHIAHAEPEALENPFDLAKNANRLSLGVTIGLRAAGLGLLADDRGHLPADIISRDVARDLHSLGDRERRVGNRISYNIGIRGAEIQCERACEKRSERQYCSELHLPLRLLNGDRSHRRTIFTSSALTAS